MAYAIEAINWTGDALVEAVRWHAFKYVRGDLKKGPSVVRTIDEVAAEAEQGEDLYLCYRGTVGRKIALVELPGGRKTLKDLPDGDQAQVLNDLPAI